ncbi:MAG: hypothetical protein RL266_2556 [Bacteroidota bacterium]|jgi:hypothetical protein
MLRTRLQWLIACLSCLLITAYFHSGKKINGVLWSDQEGYYIYLPAVFVHGGFEDVPCDNGCREVETPNGKRVFTKYTYGVALMESPFFLVAHAVAPIFGFSRDGRSLPYIWAVMIAAICYMLLGLWLLSKLLSELDFSKVLQWVVPLAILLGTNLFYYTFRESGMSHVYSFFLFALITYASHRKSNSNDLLWMILTAVPLALVVLIRPTNAMAALIPIMWASSFTDIPERIRSFAIDWRWLLTFLLACAVLFAPQLWYWKTVMGNYLFYSYGDEGFTNWNRPKVLQVLFGVQNGWFIYSPIMLTALFGLGVMMKEKIKGWQMSAVLFVLATYVFGSWWAWWFGGAYGHRCYVDLLPVMAVPFAVGANVLINRNFLVRYGFVVLAVLAIFVNIRMSDIYHGLWDGPNWTWYSYIDKLKEVFYIF